MCLNCKSLFRGQHLPVNFRGHDKSEGKTKNGYFLDMLDEVLGWGLKPAWLFALESKRTVSLEKGSWVQARKLNIPDDGLAVWLKKFGTVKVFRTWLKDRPRHHALSPRRARE